jgi:hypothetical protein
MTGRAQRTDLVAIRQVGSLLPPSLFDRLRSGRQADRNKPFPGLDPAADYHLVPGTGLTEAAQGSWQRLRTAWRAFRESTSPPYVPDSPQLATTRNAWLLPLLSELGYGRLPAAAEPVHQDGRDYPVSHLYGQIPVHLMGVGVDLDVKNPAVPGAEHASPRATVQQLLTARQDGGWGLLSNGRTLRLMRDSAAVATPSYLEFDLEAIFDDDLFDEFYLLWLLAHQSRIELLAAPAERPDAAGCWLERWRNLAIVDGAQALERMGAGVKTALEILGTGFYLRTTNQTLHALLASDDDGALTARDYNRLLQRLVYRIMFLLVAEERVALHPPLPAEGDPGALAARARYAQHFSLTALRERATTRGSQHTDLWHALRLVFRALGDEQGLPELALPGLGGIFDHDTLGVLEYSEITNADLLAALRELSVFRPSPDATLQRIDYRNLGAEELGSIYESLLELEPRLEVHDRTFTLVEQAGNERKSSGSYYTPSSLTDLLLRTTLDPLLDEAMAAPTREQRENNLLAVTVCDPACGSGHFLVAAARRIAERVAANDEGEAVASDTGLRTALHKVIDRCVYGVDLNEFAVELAKVSLWLEAMEPGKPLAFLDPQIRWGNALLGATPKALAAGIPVRAFAKLDGDDPKTAAAVGKLHRKERTTAEQSRRRDAGNDVLTLFDDVTELRDQATKLHALAEQLGIDSGDVLHDVHQKQSAWRSFENSPALQASKLLADAWCAAFVWPKQADSTVQPPTQRIFDLLRTEPDRVPGTTTKLVRELASEYHFFHWHLEFPGIFEVPDDPDATDVNPSTGWKGGFSCITGNPPWENREIPAKEWFAGKDEAIASASTAARNRLIKALPESDPQLARMWSRDQRTNFAQLHLLRNSGLYPGTGRGKVNTYMVFTELATELITQGGRAGVVVPTQIATGKTTSGFFFGLLAGQRLAALHDFDNDGKLFPKITNRNKYCVFVANGAARLAEPPDFSFRSWYPWQVPSHVFQMTPDEIKLVNPNTGNCPVFRGRRDAEIVFGIYRRIPVLKLYGSPDGNPWSIDPYTMFNMSSDDEQFRTAASLKNRMDGRFDGFAWVVEGTPEGSIPSVAAAHYLPLYEAKFTHYFDHRFSTYLNATQAQVNKGTLPRIDSELKADPCLQASPRYWVRSDLVDAKLREKAPRSWLLGWRDSARSTDTRTFIPSVVPRSAVGDKLLLMDIADTRVPSLLAMLSSFVLDYVCRQKLSSASVKIYLAEQLPVPPPAFFDDPQPWTCGKPLNEWIRPRVLELLYTSWALEGFARDTGDDGPPFLWNEERRRLLRAELDTAAFHIYQLGIEDVRHVMSSFHGVASTWADNPDDEDDDSPAIDNRERQLILELFEAMATQGSTYTSTLKPSAGDGERVQASTRPVWVDLLNPPEAATPVQPQLTDGSE